MSESKLPKLKVTKQEAVDKLTSQIKKGWELHRDFDNICTNEQLDICRTDFTKWNKYNQTLLLSLYLDDLFYKEYTQSISYSLSLPLAAQISSEKDELKRLLILLESFRERTRDFISDKDVDKRKELSSDGNKIFIVHGRNEIIRDKIDLFITKELGLETIVMEAGAHGGRTLAEKMEDYANECGFAIIIMSADDHLQVETEKENSEEWIKSCRARQNVILELGYFWGLLGRKKRIAVLIENPNEMEIPSDIVGLGYIKITTDLAHTKHELREELEAAGFSHQ